MRSALLDLGITNKEISIRIEIWQKKKNWLGNTIWAKVRQEGNEGPSGGTYEEMIEIQMRAKIRNPAIP